MTYHSLGLISTKKSAGAPESLAPRYGFRGVDEINYGKRNEL